MKLVVAFLEVTSKCNLSCPHCLLPRDGQLVKELTTNQQLNVLENLAEIGVKHLIITGGEPLVQSGLETIIERSGSLGIESSLTTNGLLATKSLVKRLARASLKHVQISLDGASRQTHEAHRGSNTFQKTVDAISLFIQSGYKTTVACILTKKNYLEIPKLFNLAKKLNVSSVRLLRLVPQNQYAREKLLLSDKELLIALKLIKENLHKLTDIGIRFDCGIPLFWLVAAKINQAKTIEDIICFSSPVCRAGTEVVCIASNGDILPCSFIRTPIGNILTDDICSCIKKSKLVKALKSPKLPRNCYKCMYFSICRGGCRAFGRFKDNAFGADPDCTNRMTKRFVRLLEGANEK